MMNSLLRLADERLLAGKPRLAAIALLAAGLCVTACGGNDVESLLAPVEPDAGLQGDGSPDNNDDASGPEADSQTDAPAADADAVDAGADSGKDAVADAKDEPLAQDASEADTANEAGPDGESDALQEAASDGGSDALEAGPDSGPDAGADALPEASWEASDDVQDAKYDVTEADAAVEPVLNGPCFSSGAVNCNGHAQQVRLLCDGTKWTSLGTCSGQQLCDTAPGPTQGSCRDQIPACVGKQPGALVCEGDSLLTCGPDLVSATSENCPFVCSSGACVGECKNGEKRCDGDTPQICDPAGQWLSGLPCGNGCAAGVCCGSGETECGDTCANLQTDGINCGSCGHDCLGMGCASGRCKAVSLYPYTGFVRKLVLSDTRVYWADSGFGRVGSVLKTGGSVIDIASGDFPSGLALDASYAYWTDRGISMGALMKSPLGGGTAVKLVEAPKFPMPVAVDSTHVYYGQDGGYLHKISVNGGTPILLATGQPVIDMVASSTDLYFTTSSGTVSRLPKTGGAPTTLASGQGNPCSIALDSMNVYWTDCQAGTVLKVPRSGGSPVTLVSGQANPFSIAVDSTDVYWTNNTTTGSVMRVAIGGGTPVMVAPWQDRPSAVAVDATHVYYVNALNLMKQAK